MTTKYITKKFKIWRFDFADVFLGSRYQEIYNSSHGEEERKSWEAKAKSAFCDEILIERFQDTLFLIFEQDTKSTYLYSPTELIELTLEKIRNDIENEIKLDKQRIHKEICSFFNYIQRGSGLPLHS